jgi:pimeloyl-ACP methyl ester carboxylesterase
MTSEERNKSLFTSALYLHGSIPLPLEGSFLRGICKELYAPSFIEMAANDVSLNTVIEEIINKLNTEETPLLCGYSMGGRILQLILSKLTYKPKLIVLMSSALPLGSTDEREARLSLDISRSQKIQLNFEDFLENWYSSKLWSLQEQNKNKVISTLLSEYDTPNKRATLAKLFTFFSPGQFPSDQQKSTDDIDPLVSLKNSPLIYFYGEYDLKYKDEAQKFKALTKNNKSYEIRGSGHKVHFLGEDQELILERISSHSSS